MRGSPSARPAAGTGLGSYPGPSTLTTATGRALSAADSTGQPVERACPCRSGHRQLVRRHRDRGRRPPTMRCRFRRRRSGDLQCAGAELPRAVQPGPTCRPADRPTDRGLRPGDRPSRSLPFPAVPRSDPPRPEPYARSSPVIAGTSRRASGPVRPLAEQRAQSRSGDRSPTEAGSPNLARHTTGPDGAHLRGPPREWPGADLPDSGGRRRLAVAAAFRDPAQ